LSWLQWPVIILLSFSFTTTKKGPFCLITAVLMAALSFVLWHSICPGCPVMSDSP
jgi:hypothetical protein